MQSKPGVVVIDESSAPLLPVGVVLTPVDPSAPVLPSALPLPLPLIEVADGSVAPDPSEVGLVALPAVGETVSVDESSPHAASKSNTAIQRMQPWYGPPSDPVHRSGTEPERLRVTSQMLGVLLSAFLGTCTPGDPGAPSPETDLVAEPEAEPWHIDPTMLDADEPDWLG